MTVSLMMIVELLLDYADTATEQGKQAAPTILVTLRHEWISTNGTKKKNNNNLCVRRGAHMPKWAV